MSIYDTQKKIADQIEECVNEFISCEFVSLYGEEFKELKEEIYMLFNALFQSLKVENNQDIHKQLLKSLDIFTNSISQNMLNTMKLKKSGRG